MLFLFEEKGIVSSVSGSLSRIEYSLHVVEDSSSVNACIDHSSMVVFNFHTGSDNRFGVRVSSHVGSFKALMIRKGVPSKLFACMSIVSGVVPNFFDFVSSERVLWLEVKDHVKYILSVWHESKREAKVFV